MPGERSKSKRPAVALLDSDPDLAAGLEEPELQAARRLAVAAIIDLDTSGWDLDEIRRTATDGWLGLFLVHGLMIRRVTVGQRSACELFGPGDLVRPWDTDGEYAPSQSRSTGTCSSRRGWQSSTPPSRCVSLAGRASPAGLSAGSLSAPAISH